MDAELRFYRQRGGAATLRAFVAFATIVVLAAAWGPSHRANLIVLVVLSIAMLWVAASTWYAAPRIGVSETDAGLISQRAERFFAFGVQRESVAWDDIDGFLVQPGVFRGQLVFASRRSGDRVRLSVRQGPAVVWSGGVTKDIASVLVERTNGMLRARGVDRSVSVTVLGG